jgi:hypothetical protein
MTYPVFILEILNTVIEQQILFLYSPKPRRIFQVVGECEFLLRELFSYNLLYCFSVRLSICFKWILYLIFLDKHLPFIDEPTNHLDMEAVIWLEDYLYVALCDSL